MIGLLDIPRYTAVNAKVRARMGRLLTPSEWNVLLNEPDIGALVQFLSGTAYREVLSPLVQGQPEIGQIERRLWQQLVRSYRAPLPFLRNDAKDLGVWLWRRFEVNNLKMVLRGVDRGLPSGRITDTLVLLGPNSATPWGALSEMSSVPGVIERLEGTFYGDALEPAVDRYRREGLLFVVEVRLDLAYQQQLLRIIQGMGGRDRQEAEKFTGTLIDSQNVLWAFRYREYFDLSPEEILNYTLTSGVRVDAALIRQIALGASMLDMLQEVWNGELPGLGRLTTLTDKQALQEAETSFGRYFYQQAMQTRVGSSQNLGIVLGYWVLQETEIQDLVSLFEGKSVGLSADQIRGYLVVGPVLSG